MFDKRHDIFGKAQPGNIAIYARVWTVIRSVLFQKQALSRTRLFFPPHFINVAQLTKVRYWKFRAAFLWDRFLKTN